MSIFGQYRTVANRQRRALWRRAGQVSLVLRRKPDALSVFLFRALFAACAKSNTTQHLFPVYQSRITYPPASKLCPQ